jgi:hypothetical protein
VSHDPAAIDAVFTIRRGDDHRRAWTLSGGDVSNWANPFLQLRSGPNEQAELLGSSEDDGTAMVTLDYDFSAEAATFAWHLDDADTLTLPIGPVWFHLTVEIDGDVTTVLYRPGRIAERVAVRSAP